MLMYLVVRAFNFKFHFTVCFSKQSVVTTATYVVASVEFGTTLTNDDATRQNGFATKRLTPSVWLLNRDRYVWSRQPFMCHLNLSSGLGSADASNFHIGEPLTVACCYGSVYDDET